MISHSLPDAPGRSRLRDGAALLGVLALIAASGIAFVAPWLPSPPPAAALDRYAPIENGAAWLTVTTGPDGAPRLWTSGAQELVPATRAFAANLRAAQARAVRAFYGTPGGDPASIDGAMAQLSATGGQITRVRERELGLTGLITDSETIALRSPEGDFVLGFYRPDTDQDLLFEPALPVMPADLSPGVRWQAAGALGGTIDYAFSGSVLAQGQYSGPAGSFEDCVQLETHTQLTLQGEPLDDILSRSWQCAGAGGVASERIGAGGAVTQRTLLVSATTSPPAANLPPPPPAALPASLRQAPAAVDPGGWELARFGRSLTAFSSGSSSFAPLWIPSDPPLVLAAAYDGALTAFEAGDPTGHVRWRFHAGGTFFGQPGYDPATGRIFAGAGDKRLYALDTRGLFLWSFRADDNIATRPVAAGNVVVFGSEDRTVYGLDAATGRLAWERPFATSGPVVSSPALVGGIVAIGSDDGQVYGLDPATGEEVWRGEAGGALRTAPAVGAGRVFVVDELGSLRALDLESGRRLWVSARDDYAGPRALVGDAGERPALVVAREDGVVELLDLDGRQLRSWSAAAARSPVEDDPSLSYGPQPGGGALWLADDNAVLLRLGPPIDGPRALEAAWYRSGVDAPFDGQSGSGLYAAAVDYRGRAVALDSAGQIYLVDPSDGRAERLARYEAAGTLPAFMPDPVLAGDTLLVNSGTTLGAVDLRDGRTLWSRAADGERRSLRPAAVAGDTVLWLTGDMGGSGTGALYAVGLADGELRWSAELAGMLAPGGIAVRGDAVYTSSPPAAFDVASGRELWRADVSGRAIGGPALSEDGRTLFVGLADESAGLVAAIDTADGKLRWSAALDSPLGLTERLWLSGDRLIVPTASDTVVALDAAGGAERWRAAPGRRWGTVTAAGGLVWQIDIDGHAAVLKAADGALTRFYTAIDASLESGGPAAGHATLVGGRMIFPLGSGLIAFEVPR